MATVKLESVLKNNYDLNYVWTIDNFRFAKSHSQKIPRKLTQKYEFELEIEYLLSGEGNSQINGSLSFCKEGTTYSRDYYGNMCYNQSATSATHGLVLSTFIAQLGENGKVGPIFNQQETVNSINEIRFTGVIARGKSYPYDSLCLCFCLTEGNQTSGPHKGLIIPSSIKIATCKKSFFVNKTTLSLTNENVFDSFCPDVRLENSNKGLQCHVGPVNTNSFCKVSVFDEIGNVVSLNERWFCEYNGIGTLEALSHEKKDIAGNFIIMIEIAFKVYDQYCFLEVPKNSPLKIDGCCSEEMGHRNIEHSLMDEVWGIYSEQKLTDLTIRVRDQSFSVHKTVLCARSPVFQKMLQSDMKEKKSGVIEIEDDSPDTVESFLNFIYSDKLPSEFHLEKFILLYSIADKYQVKFLKKKCADMLKSRTTTGNVFDILKVADMHHDDSLKEASFVFMKSKADTFFVSEEWKEFMMCNLHLAAEAMHFCLMKK